MILLILLLSALLQPGYTLNNGLALTPPMGWLHWERYRCNVDCENEPDSCISENLFKKAADLLVSEGYLDVGYEYVIIDDCWLTKERDSAGRLQPDPNRFPSGLKALADYIHSKGLKFGMYQDIGTKTCAGYPGIFDHFDIDAKTFAEWGIDYLKVDGCNHPRNASYQDDYIKFGQALNATGRPIVYACSWPFFEGGINTNYPEISNTCNVWRNYGDIDDNWATVSQIFDWFGNHQDIFGPYSGPGHWNDPDMLVVGDYGLNYEESRTQMALWAIMAAPLLMSVDLASVRPDQKAILQNKELIAVNQDPLGIMGRRVYKKDNLEVWTKPILPIINENQSFAVAVLNRQTSNRPRKVEIKLNSVGLNAPKYILKDLYDPKKSPKEPTGTINTYVNPHGVVVYKAIPVKSD